MKKSLRIFFVAGLLFAAHSAVSAQFGSICGDPSQKQCAGQYDGFAPHDLIFNTGRAELGTGTRHESDEFYAVVLESVRAEKQAAAADSSARRNAERRKSYFPNIRFSLHAKVVAASLFATRARTKTITLRRFMRAIRKRKPPQF